VSTTHVRGGVVSGVGSMIRIMTESADVEPTTPAEGLTEDEVAMLDLERRWWKFVGAKESQIRERFDISATVYYLRLNALLDKPAALEADPMLVRRLLRIRESQRAHRSAHRMG
jgi:hypothetical protein